jgi:hypothetical protein
MVKHLSKSKSEQVKQEQVLYRDGCGVGHVTKAAVMRSQRPLDVADELPRAANMNVGVLKKPVGIRLTCDAAVVFGHDNVMHTLLDKVVEAVYLLLDEATNLNLQTPDLA